MKKILVLLALSFALYGYSFGQTVTKTEPQKVDHSGIKSKEQKKEKKEKVDGGKHKGDKYDKHKHKHKHKHMKHTKKHKG